jgi:3-oxoadipate enol-lactonase
LGRSLYLWRYFSLIIRKGSQLPDVTIADRTIYYESHGEGYPLLLIRGFGSNADHWYAQVPDLSRHYRVITFDNRGVARSGHTDGPFSIEDLARDTIALMDALEIERAHVLGLSMGGMIAQEMAVAHPQRVKGLILAVTHCGGKAGEPAEEHVGRAFQRLVDEGSTEARTEALSYLFGPRAFEEKQQIVQEYVSVSMKNPVALEVLKNQWQAVQGHDACDRLQTIKSYTLILTGSEDMVIPPVNSTIMAERIPRSEMVIITGCGHQVLIEEPEMCNTVMLDFLKKVDNRAD